MNRYRRLADWFLSGLVAALFAITLLEPIVLREDRETRISAADLRESLFAQESTAAFDISEHRLAESSNVTLQERNLIADAAEVPEMPKVEAAPVEPVPFARDEEDLVPQLADIEPAAANQVAVAPAAEPVPAATHVEQEPSRSTHAPVAAKLVSSTPATPQPSPSPAPTETVQVRPPQRGPWPVPTALIEQLNAMAQHRSTKEFATRAKQEIERMTNVAALESDEAAKQLKRLASLAEEAEYLARESKDDAQRVQLARIEYGLQRRLEVWRRVHAISGQSHTPATIPDVAPEHVSRRMADVEHELGQYGNVEAWKRYLLLDPARQSLSENTGNEQRRGLLRRILERIDSPRLTERQRAVFDRPVFRLFRRDLQQLASEPIDYRTLLEELELYESDRSMQQAQLIAQRVQSLRWSPNPAEAELGQHIETHYRNANVRASVSVALLNRFLPPPQRMQENVRSVIAGAAVYGVSELENRLRVQFIPDPSQLRLVIEAYGSAASETESYKGPVVFYDEGLSHYVARKQITIDRTGFRSYLAEADAENDTHMTGLESEFDGVPLIGSLVRSYARQQRNDREAQARSEAEEMLSERVSEQLDREVDKQVEQAARSFDEKLLKPLHGLQLDPVPVSLQTTEERMIVRYRLAGESQLAAHTPRPRALSNSLFSVQLHESAINNAIEQLKLDGNSFGLHELFKKINATLGNENGQIPADLPDNVEITFAEHDAVRINFDDDKATVTLRVAKLSIGRLRKWRDLTVRVDYLPQRNGLAARFDRDNGPDAYISISGQRLRFGDRIALNGVFSKTFPPESSISLLPKSFSEDPRLADLHVSDFNIDDGWIGLAIAPNPNYRRPGRTAGAPVDKR